MARTIGMVPENCLAQRISWSPKGQAKELYRCTFPYLDIYRGRVMVRVKPLGGAGGLPPA